MKQLSSQPYKGARDWYPEDKALQNYIFGKWREAVESFGFKEYSAPLLEPLDVYAAKSGDELAGEEAYAFEDRGGRMVAIRPEMTPSVSRMVASRRQELAYPAKLYSIANFMRYERPQRGREREFWQLNVDTFGVDDVAMDAESVQLADQIMKSFGARADMYEIHLNSRALIDEVTDNYLQLDESKSKQLVRLIDRRNKMSAEVFSESVASLLDGDSGKITRLEQLLGVNVVDDLPAELAQTDGAVRLQQLLSTLYSLGVGSVKFDISLMRGLDYYTGMVFEVFDVDPANNRALFGGGRYDGLVGMFGVEPISAVGFAPGLTTTEIFLRSHDLIPNLDVSVDIYVAAVGEGVELDVLALASRLRAQGLSVESDTSGRKFDKLIRTAEKKGAREIVFVGQNEIDSGSYRAKNLQTGDERIIA